MNTTNKSNNNNQPLICRTCKQPFLKKTIKKGFIDQCDNCSIKQREPRRYIGVHNGVGKSANIEIFRTNLKNVKGYLNNNSQVTIRLQSTTKEDKP